MLEALIAGVLLFAAGVVAGVVVTSARVSVRARDELKTVERHAVRMQRDRDERAKLAIRQAALANYRSGLRDGMEDVLYRVLGEHPPHDQDGMGAAVYDGPVNGPLRRWVLDARARLGEHVA